MTPSDEIERLLAGYRVTTDAALDRRVLADASAALARGTTMAPVAKPSRFWIWSIIMQNNWTKSAAAATILAVAGVTLVILARSATPSYALEQTLKANQAVRTVHARNVSPPAAEPQDMWLEYDDRGGVLRLRLEEGVGKTFRIMVWAKGELRWFSPSKNEFIVMHAADVQQELRSAMELWDPKFALESIHRLEQQGAVKIQVKMPKADGEPITVEATETKRPEELPVGGYPLRYVFLVDPKSKVVIQRDTYRLVKGSYGLHDRRRYLEYYAPIDPGKFVLEPPKAVKLEDRTQGIGMAQDKMTDAEAAAAVLRQYLEALITKDYATAGRLYNGKPADELRQRIEEQLKVRYLRVVAIGKAEPKPEGGPRVFQVPFAVELEKDGVKEIAGPPVKSGAGPRTQRKVTVRPVVGKPDRWVIEGGI